MEPTRSGPSASLLVRTTTDTGGLESCAPAFAAPLARRQKWRTPIDGCGVGVRGEYRRILIDQGEGAAEDGSGRTAVLFEDYSFGAGKVTIESSKAALDAPRKR